MLATEVRPSRRKRTVADPSAPGLRASRTIFVGNAASSSGSTSASPQWTGKLTGEVADAFRQFRANLHRGERFALPAPEGPDAYPAPAPLTA